MRHLPVRSELSVPGSSPRMIEKAVGSDADAVLIDLEDSVTPAKKAESRENVVRAMRELDWGDRLRAYRVNPVGTPYLHRDILDVVEAAGDRIDSIVVPKVSRPEELIAIDILLTGLEADLGVPVCSIGLEAQIESALGLTAVEGIARSTTRLVRLNFGPGDFSADVHMPMENIGMRGKWDALYPGHRFHYPMSRIVVAARSAGLDAIDGPVAAFRDLEGFQQSCEIARALGYDGKWCIHPVQIPIANEIFSPTPEEIAWAGRVLTAYEESMRSGRGAVGLDGTMIDVASIRLAERTLATARRIEQR